MNVYQKINEVKKTVAVFEKDAATNGKGAYKYVSGSQILGSVKGKMEELGLLFLPIETENRNYEKFNYKNQYGDEKTDFLVSGKLVYEWIDIDNPTDRQRVLFDYYGQQSDLSKAFGSALTYSERYLLLKSLGIPTDDEDPDKGRTDKPMVQPKKAGGKEEKKQELSKAQKISELIKGTDVQPQEITNWIENNLGSPKRVNDLTDEEFKKLYTALERAIKET